MKKNNEFITTSQLSDLCGVSRFTVINWINSGKIKANKTMGGHCRIGARETIDLLEKFNDDQNTKNAANTNNDICWKYFSDSGCERNCGNCLIKSRNIGSCEKLVSTFGKEIIRCSGECSDCEYSGKKQGGNSSNHIIETNDNRDEMTSDKSVEKITDRKDHNKVSSLGFNIGHFLGDIKSTIKKNKPGNNIKDKKNDSGQR
jgi:excisionase family DNA binding protein